MQIDVLKTNKDRMSFMLKKTNSTFANTLRRLIMDEVPTLAIEKVEFESNNSILYDEMLALRLGLIPLVTDIKSYNIPSECKCKGEGCARCEVKLTLEAKGEQTVYAKSLKSQDPGVKPVHLNTPIVKLIEDQDIKLTATASLGMGKTHAKWSPGHVTFKQMPTIDIDKKASIDERCIEVCPLKKHKILEKKSNSIVVNKDKLVECSMCEACSDCSPGIKVGAKDDTFVFTIEKWGQLKFKEILLKALDIMDTHCDELKAQLRG